GNREEDEPARDPPAGERDARATLALEERRQHEREKRRPRQEPDQPEGDEIAGTVGVPDRRIAWIDQAKPLLPGHDVAEGVPGARAPPRTRRRGARPPARGRGRAGTGGSGRRRHAAAGPRARGGRARPDPSRAWRARLPRRRARATRGRSWRARGSTRRGPR